MLDLAHYYSQHPNATLVTATQRLARHLLHNYNLEQARNGLTSWPTPDILPWTAWVQREWRNWVLSNQVDVTLISNTQSLYLWQYIIEADAIESDTHPLLNARSTARHSQETRQLTIDYGLDLTDKECIAQFAYDDDASHWLEWHRQYKNNLASSGWVDGAAIAKQLVVALKREEILPDSVAFIGFDAFTPLQYQLFDALRNIERYIDEPKAQCGQAMAQLYAAENANDEIRQSACWARQLFENAWKDGDLPIGIVIPRLEQYRHQAARIFREVFYPQDGVQDIARHDFRMQGVRDNAVFNLSLGYPLSYEPIVSTALQILSLCHVNFDYEIFSDLLRSPFIGQGREQAGLRSLLDLQLRRRTHAESSLYDLLVAMPEVNANGSAADIQAWIHELSNLKQAWQGRAYPSIWVERIYQCLKLFGWPNRNSGDSYHQQVMQSLDEVLFEFSRLDQLKRAMDLSQAVSRVTHMLQAKVFQPASDEAPIQILGMLESAGMQFSALWVTGMTEQEWPSPSQPNVFIPLSLQRKYSMPRCLPSHEYDYATRQTHRLIHSTDTMIFSYPQHGENDETYLPSPLINRFQSIEKNFTDVYEVDVVEQPAFEYLLDITATPVDMSDVNQTQVGTQVIRDQSACPFRAFVSHRLHAKLPEAVEPGNDPRLRGEIVHKIMQQLWRQWCNADVLMQLDGEDLARQIKNVIEQVVQQHAWRISADHALEQQRLFNLVMEWLTQEKQRQPFSTHAQEQESWLDINGLRLRMFIDRVDTLADGSCCVVDYKTGEARSTQWIGDRPEEPQLPLYALSQSEHCKVTAVAFANVRAGECKYEGVTRDRSNFVKDDKELRNIREIPITRGQSLFKEYEDWDDMLQTWQTVITDLANEYLQGRAEVDPSSWPTLASCQYCDIKPVCRIFDLESTWSVEDD